MKCDNPRSVIIPFPMGSRNFPNRRPRPYSFEQLRDRTTRLSPPIGRHLKLVNSWKKIVAAMVLWAERISFFLVEKCPRAAIFMACFTSAGAANNPARVAIENASEASLDSN
jgi:hypothetical protein